MLLAATGLTVVAYGGLVTLDQVTGTLRDGYVPQTVAWYWLAWLGFGLALWSSERRSIPTAVFWLVPLVARVVLWSTEPTLSDDVYRYLWDGHLLTSGVNPYDQIVASPQLDAYHIPIRDLVNNPVMSTPYLPATQGVFALAAAVGPPRPLVIQVVMSLFDMATAGLIVVLLSAARLPARRVLLYWWNPLVIVETAHGAHLDAFMVFAALAAVVTLRLHRACPDRALDQVHAPGWVQALDRVRTLGRGMAWTLSPLLMAAATLTRGLPALFAVVLWWRWTWPQRILYGLGSAVPIAAFAVGPGLGLGQPLAGVGVFGASRLYAEQWQFNSQFFHLLSGIARRAGALDPGATSRLVAVLAMASAAAGFWWRSRPSAGATTGAATTAAANTAAALANGNRQLLRIMSLLMMIYVVLTPTLHPWYLIAPAALAPFVAPGADEAGERWWLLAPWAFLGFAVILSYLTYLDPAAHAELAWVRRVEWFPTFALLAGVALWFRTRAPIASRRPTPQG